nr:immunoglobulin light chain junction region [Macaca mulatta]MOW39858.1 immunoglobulin light chain junction region [Macaca mulatta]MOW39908.1 immunoglobulin light chain junction region [Macaca mulatta]MOW40126.1 immunoglobulin light chain junction region [Macaca mulatta]MOW40189.1 immunoglobulin light chain junction region [Macaca mulatta]
CQQYNNWNNF